MFKERVIKVKRIMAVLMMGILVVHLCWNDVFPSMAETKDQPGISDNGIYAEEVSENSVFSEEISEDEIYVEEEEPSKNDVISNEIETQESIDPDKGGDVRELVDYTATATKYKDTAYYQADDFLGVANRFHIFASNSVVLSAHCNGNFASPEVTVGTACGNNQCKADGIRELTYAGKLNHNGATICSYDIALGKANTTVTKTDGSALLPGILTENQILLNEVIFNLDTMQKLYLVDDDFIDFDAEFSNLRSKSKKMSELSTTLSLGATNDSTVEGTYNLSDNNNAYIYLADGVNILNCTASNLANAGTLNIKGMHCNENTTIAEHRFSSSQSLIVNVDCAGSSTVAPSLETKYYCDCGTAETIGNGEDNYYQGTMVIWNFYDSSASDKMFTGTVSPAKVVNGSYLAPNANIIITQNANGNLIGKNVTIQSGESHRADFIGMAPTLSGEDVTASLTVSKKALTAAGTELSGASMNLSYTTGTKDLSGVSRVAGPLITTAADDKSITWTTNGTPLELSGLPVGEYTLTEEDAPAGYAVAASVDFKVDTDGKIYKKVAGTYSNTETGTITVVDAALADPIKLIKTYSDSKSPAENAKFTLYTQVDCATGTEVSGAAQVEAKWSVSENKYLVEISDNSNVETGHTYYLKEVSAPNGYVISSNIYCCRVAANGDVEYKLSTEADTAYSSTFPTCENTANSGGEDVTASLTVSKKALTAAGTELSGASMNLSYTTGTKDLSGVSRVAGPLITTAADDKSITWTTNGTPLELSGLPVGEYTLTEEDAPAGYAVAASVDFKVDTDGKIYKKVGGIYSNTETGTITVVDAALADPIKLIKTYSDSKSPAENAKFTLYTQVDCATGTEVSGAAQIEAAWSVSESKYIVEISDNSNVETGHTYYLKEVSAPNGYVISSNIYCCRVAANGDVEYKLSTEADTAYSSTFPTCENTANSGGTDDAEDGSSGTDDGSSSTDDGNSDTTEDGSSDEQDEDETGTLVVTIYDTDTGKVVTEAEVEITDPNGKKTTYTTDENGQITIEDAVTGTYTAVIKKSADGSSVNKTLEFTVKISDDSTTKKSIKVEVVKNSQTTNSSSTATGSSTGSVAVVSSTKAIKTGDNFNIILPIVGLCSSLLLIMLILWRKKKKVIE